MNRTHFWIPAADPRAEEEELNRFIRAHRVLSVEEVFVAAGAGSAWAVSVSWLDGASSSAQSKGKIDYREILDASTFELFASMRRWRRAHPFSGSRKLAGLGGDHAARAARGGATRGSNGSEPPIVARRLTPGYCR